jgi:putative membrane protein insertion efficiency factor
MHGLLPAQRVTTFTPGDHHAGTAGESCAAQSPAAASPRSIPAESSGPSGRLGHPGQSSRIGGESLLRHATERTAAPVSPSAPGVGDRIGYREQGTGDRETVPCNLYPITFGVLLKPLALGLIRFYQACFSPAMPSTCRFHPSCSAYAFEAVEKWGVGKGGLLTLRRLLRCRPWGSYGYDPVPERQVTGYREQVIE